MGVSLRQFLEREFPKLVDLLYDAGLDATCWPAFLDALGKGFSAVGVLHLLDKPIGATPAFMPFGTDPEFLASYQQYYAAINPYPTPSFAAAPIGKVAVASDILPASTIEGGEFYNDWMKPQGISPHHLGALLRRDGSGAVLLAVAPHASVLHRDRQRYARQLQLLVPHLMRAVELNRVTTSAEVWRQGAAHALQSLGAAAFLLDGIGHILLANTYADELMRHDRVVCVGRSGELEACQADANRKLQAALTTGAGDRVAAPVRLVSQKTGRAFVAWALAGTSAMAPPGGRLASVANLNPTTAAVLVLVVSVVDSTHVPVDMIAAVFGLSAAEARLVSALAAGHTLHEYAKVAGLSRNTVRNQLSSVFEKTGTARQAELVVRVVNTVSPPSVPAAMLKAWQERVSPRR